MNIVLLRDVFFWIEIKLLNENYYFKWKPIFWLKIGLFSEKHDLKFFILSEIFFWGKIDLFGDELNICQRKSIFRVEIELLSENLALEWTSIFWVKIDFLSENHSFEWSWRSEFSVKIKFFQRKWVYRVEIEFLNENLSFYGNRTFE